MVQKPAKAAPRQPAFAMAFGCSHLEYLLTDPLCLERIAPKGVLPFLRGRAFGGGAIAGLRPQDSTLNTKEVIHRRAPNARRLVLAFGQVDLEFGFYHRNLVKGEGWAVEAYVDWLIGIYTDFAKTLAHPAPDRIAFKAPNLTVAKTDAFRIRYMSKIIAGQLPPEMLAALPRDLTGTGLSAREQDAMTLLFNQKLSEACMAQGWRFFDINPQLAARNAAGARDMTLGIDPAFIPAADDHHLADTLEVRRLHHQGVLDAFA